VGICDGSAVVGTGDGASQSFSQEQTTTRTEPASTATLAVDDAAKLKPSLFSAAGSAATAAAANASQTESPLSSSAFEVAAWTAAATSAASAEASRMVVLLDAQSSDPAAPEMA
jgi:hypothetical protein